MQYLYIFVEGEHDKVFFEKLFDEHLEIKSKYQIKFISYANEKKEKVQNYYKSIIKMKAIPLFFADLDKSPCPTQKKEKIKNTYGIIDKVFIVIKEIESWFLAGLSKDDSEKLKISYTKDTNSITKENFRKLANIPRTQTELNLKIEIMKHFDVKMAIERNKSFKYFYEKFLKI